MSRTRHLGFWTGVGLVVANMVGAGVFLSAGFMVADLDAAEILLSWVVGLGIALCGTAAYASIALRSGESGGEYRYLHDYLHPWLGSVAGWASLFVGFAAPVAVSVEAAGAFAQTVVPAVDPVWFGTAAIVGLTTAHAVQLDWSRNVQNGLVAIKALMVAVFVGIGVLLGSADWPTWTPTNDSGSFPWAPFAANQYWVAFAFSGWNAAIYAAAEFRRPRQDVARSMLVGCLAVGLAYLACNWVFVANLEPARASLVTETDRITLAHLVMEDLLGPAAGTVTSLVIVLVLLSSVSAMTLVGPRVYGAMGADGLLPRAFGPSPGRPPVVGLVAQAGVALLFLHGRTILQSVQAAGAVLMLFSALVCATVWVLVRRGDDPPGWPARAAATIYVVAVVALLVAGFATQPGLGWTVGAVVGLGTVGWLVQRRARSG